MTRDRDRGRRGRAVAALVAATLVGTACSFGGSGNRAAAPEPGTGGDTSCGEVRDGVRVVTDALGEVEVPLRPERIVVLDTGELDAAAAVGV
ncbi:MAG: hypothetical protein AB7L84_08590 [Acidimicrobiia bacterium]